MNFPFVYRDPSCRRSDQWRVRANVGNGKRLSYGHFASKRVALAKVRSIIEQERAEYGAAQYKAGYDAAAAEYEAQMQVINGRLGGTTKRYNRVVNGVRNALELLAGA
jgi:hypothetical protein